MNKKQLVAEILKDVEGKEIDNVELFAPSNIALVKYWGSVI